jgi:hypothetical protein
MGVGGQIHEGTALCESGAALDGFWRREKSVGVRTPDHPVLSQSLYQL